MTQVREGADLVIDTSQMTIYDLRTRSAELFSDGGLSTLMQTSLQSFGYKHGAAPRRRPGDRLPVPARTRSGTRICGR